MEEVLYGNPQTIAKFLDRGNRGATISSADDVVDGGLGHTAHAAEFIDGNVTLPAQFQYSFLDRFTDVHGAHLFSLTMISGSACKD